MDGEAADAGGGGACWVFARTYRRYLDRHEVGERGAGGQAAVGGVGATRAGGR